MSSQKPVWKQVLAKQETNLETGGGAICSPPASLLVSCSAYSWTLKMETI
jgi:hypothetical protein